VPTPFSSLQLIYSLLPATTTSKKNGFYNNDYHQDYQAHYNNNYQTLFDLKLQQAHYPLQKTPLVFCTFLVPTTTGQRQLLSNLDPKSPTTLEST
jgi:hypothetical protein